MQKQIRIVLTGVESSGKTVLAQSLAKHFNIPLIPEYAREYLAEIKTNYIQEDLLEIAKGQLESINSEKNKIIICDTDLQVIKIWSLVKYNSVDEKILELYKNNCASLYILCSPDFEWEFDELRENKFDRNKIHAMYLDELNANNLNYIEASGTLEERKDFCVDCISNQFSAYI